jgi:hypothetical protein
MFYITSIFLLLVITSTQSQSDAEVQAIIAQVRGYLTRSSSRSAVPTVSNEQLQNSNKIGLGYNPILGSPVCYNGDCQMEGFTRPVFNLSFTKRPEGACTNKLIPENVDIDCVPSVTISANTEILSTLNKLFESTVNSIEFSAAAKYMGSSFSYTHSTQTRSMIDTIVQQNSTVLFTNAKISFVKLSSFAPRMDLSDNFRYVIKNLPCCSYSQSIE